APEQPRAARRRRPRAAPAARRRPRREEDERGRSLRPAHAGRYLGAHRDRADLVGQAGVGRRRRVRERGAGDRQHHDVREERGVEAAALARRPVAAAPRRGRRGVPAARGRRPDAAVGVDGPHPRGGREHHPPPRARPVLRRRGLPARVREDARLHERPPRQDRRAAHARVRGHEHRTADRAHDARGERGPRRHRRDAARRRQGGGVPRRAGRLHLHAVRAPRGPRRARRADARAAHRGARPAGVHRGAAPRAAAPHPLAPRQAGVRLARGADDRRGGDRAPRRRVVRQGGGLSGVAGRPRALDRRRRVLEARLARGASPLEAAARLGV
ncbi:MAG: 3'-_5' exoribonuclease Bsu YhaM, partial [uncultured Gemmatimonadaceae bacterium]